MSGRGEDCASYFGSSTRWYAFKLMIKTSLGFCFVFVFLRKSTAEAIHRKDKVIRRAAILHSAHPMVGQELSSTIRFSSAHAHSGDNVYMHTYI